MAYQLKTPYQFKKGFHIEILSKDNNFFYCKILEEDKEIRLTTFQFYNKDFENPFKKDAFGTSYGKYAFELLQEDDDTDKLLDERALWRSMIERALKKKTSAYQNVSICEEWLCLSNFLVDVVALPGYAEWKRSKLDKENALIHYHLDKDLRNKNNELFEYNKENCWFIPANMNCSYSTIKKHWYFCFNIKTKESDIAYSSKEAFDISVKGLETTIELDQRSILRIVDKKSRNNDWIFLKIKPQNKEIEDTKLSVDYEYIKANNLNEDLFFIIDCKNNKKNYSKNIFEFMKNNNKNYYKILKLFDDNKNENIYFYNNLLIFILDRAAYDKYASKTIHDRGRKSIDEMRKVNEIVAVNIKTQKITLVGRRNFYYTYKPNHSINMVDFYTEHGTCYSAIVRVLMKIDETAGGHVYYRINDFCKKYNLMGYDALLKFIEKTNSNTEQSNSNIKKLEYKFIALNTKTNEKLYFSTITEMSSFLNIKYDTIKDVLAQRRNSAFGYKFEYNENSSIKKRDFYEKNKFGFIGIRLEDNYKIWFDNQKEFANKFGLLNSKISDVVSGRRKTHKGWTFRRATEEEFLFLQKDF